MKNEKWFESGIPMDWHKNLPMIERRRNALQTHKGDNLATARALNQIANVTQDKETERIARFDAKYFFMVHRKTGK